MKKPNAFQAVLAPALLFGLLGIAQAGTCLPPCDVEGTLPEIRLLDTGTDQDWEIEATSFGFEIDQNGGVNGTSPFQIEPGAGSDQLVLDDVNNVGINTDAPQSSHELEVAGNAGTGDTFAAIAVSPGGPTDDSARISVNDFSDTFNIGVRTGSGGYNSPVAIHLNAGNNKLTMESGGRVGIGGLTIQQINTAATLHVEGSGDVSGNLFLDSTGLDDWLIDPGNSGLWFRNGNATSSPAPVKFGNDTPTDSLVVEDTSGDVGVGLSSPVADLHVRGEGVGAAEEVLWLESAVPPRMMLRNSSTGKNWRAGMNAGNHLILTANGTGKTEARFARNGNLKIAGNLTQGSDRNNKEGIEPVDNASVLEAVAELPISIWEYKEQDGVKHLGPMAQDFHAAFGLGNDPKGISSIDTGGVALAAIKGLNEVGQSRDKVIEILKAENEELTARLTMLENLVNKLTAKEVVMNQ
ncbi:MAG: tail fiber domain-containing protein [Pseudomonadota bacterium]